MVFPIVDSILETIPAKNILNLDRNETFLLNRLYVKDKVHFNFNEVKLFTEIICNKINNTKIRA